MLTGFAEYECVVEDHEIYKRFQDESAQSRDFIIDTVRRGVIDARHSPVLPVIVDEVWKATQTLISHKFDRPLQPAIHPPSQTRKPRSQARRNQPQVVPTPPPSARQTTDRELAPRPPQPSSGLQGHHTTNTMAFQSNQSLWGDNAMTSTLGFSPPPETSGFDLLMRMADLPRIPRGPGQTQPSGAFSRGVTTPRTPCISSPDDSPHSILPPTLPTSLVPTTTRSRPAVAPLQSPLLTMPLCLDTGLPLPAVNPHPHPPSPPAASRNTSTSTTSTPATADLLLHTPYGSTTTNTATATTAGSLPQTPHGSVSANHSRFDGLGQRRPACGMCAIDPTACLCYALQPGFTTEEVMMMMAGLGEDVGGGERGQEFDDAAAGVGVESIMATIGM